MTYEDYNNRARAYLNMVLDFFGLLILVHLDLPPFR